MRKTAPFFAAMVGLALFFAWGSFGGNNADSSLQLNLASVQSTLGGTQEQLAAAQAELAAARSELASVAERLLIGENQLISTVESLTATQAELDSARLELGAAEQGLEERIAETVSLRSDLSSAEVELAAAKRASAAMTAQFHLSNPTYDQAVSFLLKDTTNTHPYSASSYDCRDYSADVLKNAGAAGIRGGYVSIQMRQGSHAVVAFDTVDRGLVYFEPQNDKEVVLPAGQSYMLANGYKALASQDDTIVRVVVIW